MKYTIIFFILFILLVLLKFNLIYQMFNSSIQEIKWKRKNLAPYPEKIEKIKIRLSANSLSSHYQKYPSNSVNIDPVALYEDEIVDKTFQKHYPNPSILGKTDSLPHKIGYFTTPVNLLGKIQGESIFRWDYESRGKNNKQKREYMKALTPHNLSLYQQKISNYLKKSQLIGFYHNLEYKCHRICIDLFYILHFDTLPLPKDYLDAQIFLDAVIQFPFHTANNWASLRQINNLKSFYHKSLDRMHKLKKNPRHCLVSEWQKTELTEGDIFIELIHNLLAMVANWFNTLYPYLIAKSQNKIPPLSPELDKLEKRAYLQECFRYLSPVQFASSLVKNPSLLKETFPEKVKNKINDKGYYLHLYDIKNVNLSQDLWGAKSKSFDASRFGTPEELKKTTQGTSKCPFLNTMRNATFHHELPIYEKDGYLPFGDGYRRCPGEFLSMIFLEEVALLIGDRKVKVTLIEGESKPAKYIWGLIETNYQVYIS